MCINYRGREYQHGIYVHVYGTVKVPCLHQCVVVVGFHCILELLDLVLSFVVAANSRHLSYWEVYYSHPSLLGAVGYCCEGDY